MYTLNIRIYVSWIKKKYIDIKRHIFIYIKRHIFISGRTNIENQFHQFEATSSIQSHPIRGKQKFEMLTMQFPCCPSSATLENRILLHGSNQPGAVEQPAVLMLHFRIKKNLIHPEPFFARLSTMNATYAKGLARTKILEVLAWSCNALGIPT